MIVRLPGLIEPFDEARVVNCAYELSMGQEGYVTSSESQTKDLLASGQQLRIPPGQFAQLLTEEVVEMPPDALGMISIKSRFKLRGLVNVSGFHVDPGFKGRLLFSVYNAGPNDIVVSRGSPVFLLWYASLDGETADVYTGDRAGQTRISDEDVMRLHGDVSTPHALAARVAKLEHRLSARHESILVAAGAIGGAIVGVVLTLVIDKMF